MTRKFFFFSEMGYNAYPDEEAEKYGYTNLMFPNSIFDAETARDLWQMFLREHEYASELGFDGSFEKHVGMTVDEFYDSYNAFMHEGGPDDPPPPGFFPTEPLSELVDFWAIESG